SPHLKQGAGSYDMTLMKPRVFLLGTLLASFSLFAQQNPSVAPGQQKSNAPAPTAQQKSTTQAPATEQTPAAKKPDRAAAYYHFGLAHMYEEMVAMYGRSEYATKAIEEYRLAIEADPSSEFLNAGLAELYAKTGRIRDAVDEARDIIKRDPN